MAGRSTRWPESENLRLSEMRLLILQAIRQPALDLGRFLAGMENKTPDELVSYFNTMRFGNGLGTSQWHTFSRMFSELECVFAYCKDQCIGAASTPEIRVDYLRQNDPMQAIGDECLFLECLARSELKVFFSRYSLWDNMTAGNKVMRSLYSWTMVWTQRSPQMERAIEDLATYMTLVLKQRLKFSGSEQFTADPEESLDSFFAEYEWMRSYCPHLEQALDEFTKSWTEPLTESCRKLLTQFFKLLPVLQIEASKPLEVISRVSVALFGPMNISPELLQLVKVYSGIITSPNG
eukprot:Gregarina_sp_Poly_1__374@NODE_1092_length_5120_cov_13_801306_g757_i0_p1_GENE_NODE_1092_length_5120_cov_13_801306_g757_i0NODE_1092_length_5120_cov_13_801306_g757_i0_p1_ORF_typecomplete_len293_score33_40P66_CC/PF16563_5/0_14_NODE_1092_length_5120_cov_13_801306_g757_i031013979